MKLTNNIYFNLLFIITQLTSLRFFYNFHLTKDNPFSLFLIYLTASILVFYILQYYRLIKKITSSSSLFYICLTLITIYIFYKYPLSIGSERDDCYVILLNNLSNFHFPYSKTSLGDPCSTGLSSLIFYFPVIFYENYFSFTYTLYLLLFYLFLKRYLNKSTLIFIIYIQMFNLLYLEDAIAGSDFFFISISYLVGILYLNKYFKHNKTYDFFIAFIMLFFFYGSRLPFFFLMPINYLIFLGIYNYKIINKFFIPQLCISSIVILIPFLISPFDYHPAHIFFKGYGIIGPKMIILFLFFCFLIFLTGIILYFKSDRYKSYYLKFVKYFNVNLHLVLFSLPLFLVIIKTWIHRLDTNQISNWEGLSYFILIYPSIIFVITSLFKKEEFLN